MVLRAIHPMGTAQGGHLSFEGIERSITISSERTISEIVFGRLISL